MTKATMENLKFLSKEQLVKLINDFYYACAMTCETLVNVSKCHITETAAIEKIRDNMDILNKYKLADKHLPDRINLELGKITVEEYRDIVLGEDE